MVIDVYNEYFFMHLFFLLLIQLHQNRMRNEKFLIYNVSDSTIKVVDPKLQKCQCIFFEQLFTIIPLNHGNQSLKGLNLVRCWKRNMFGLRDDILPLGGQPIFISIARYKAYIWVFMKGCLSGSGYYEKQPKFTNVFNPEMSTRLPRQTCMV